MVMCVYFQLFNLLLGIGIPFTIAFIKNGGKPIPVVYNKMVVVLTASLAVSLITSLIMMPVSRFRAKRAHGFVLVAIYVVLLSAALLVEFTVIE